MDIRKKVLAAILLIVASSQIFARKQPKPIKIGDKIPDLVIKGIINKSSDSVALKNLYKDGLLIIDFWATWCAPCITEMQFLDSLKAKHPGKFNVLMVTRESEALIQKFMAKNPKNKSDNLLVAVNDTSLYKHFPHRAIPHNIWIDRNGIVKAITSFYEVTEDNIMNFEDTSRHQRMILKKDRTDFNPMSQFHLGDSTFTYRSIITPRLPAGSAGRYGGSRTSHPQNYFQWNTPILYFYLDAFSLYSDPASKLIYSSPYLKSHLVEVHTKDSLKIFLPSGKLAHLLKGSKYKNKEEWGLENTFAYNLSLPKPVPHEQFREYMFQDLERQFNIRPSIEQRKTRCIVVSRPKKINPGGTHAKSAGKPSIKWLAPDRLEIRNANITQITSWIFSDFNETYLKDPFIMEVKAADDFYIDAVFDFSSEKIEPERRAGPEMIYEKLKAYGFEFKPDIRKFPKLVLYDLN